MSRHDKTNRGKPKRPKTRLDLPDLDHSRSAVLDSLRSRESKRGYRHAIDEFIQWYCSEPRLSFNKIVVTRFRIFLENRNLAAGTINGRLAAVRRLAYEAADAGLLSPELAAGIRRVKGVKKLGVRLRKLAHGRGGTSLLAIASIGHTQRKERPRHPCRIAWLWAASPRIGRSRVRALAATRRTLGDSRSHWQRRSHSDRASARVGQDDDR